MSFFSAQPASPELATAVITNTKAHLRYKSIKFRSAETQEIRWQAEHCGWILEVKVKSRSGEVARSQIRLHISPDRTSYLKGDIFVRNLRSFTVVGFGRMSSSRC